MPKKNYTPTQTAHLKMVQQVHLEKVAFKAALRAELERRLKDEMGSFVRRESYAANNAFDAGVTKADIGRALGTANWNTIKDVLALTKTPKETL